MAIRHSNASNLYEMMTGVRETLLESTASKYSDLEIYNKLNQAQLNITRKSLCLKKEVTVTVSDGVREYDLRTSTNSFSDIIDIAEDGVYFYVNGSTYLPLKYKTKADLNKEYPNWQGQSSGIPQFYYYNKATKTIGIHPKPNASNAGAYLFINGYHKPKIMTAGTASSGSTTTLVMPAGSSTVPYPSVTNDYYNGLYVEIYSGTGSGQNLLITDYVASTRTLTFATATAPDSTSIFGFCPEIPEEAQYLMPLYALWKLWPKGGSRVNLGNNYRQEYVVGLGEFIGETIDENDEVLIKDSF
jgi:hypothetical protein